MSDSAPNLPLTSMEIRGRPRQDPTAEIPEELRSLSQEEPPPREFRFFDRAAVAERFADEGGITMDAYRPAWVGASFEPRRTRLAHPPVVEHRGDRLNPLVVWGNDDRDIYNDTAYPWGCVCKITDAFGRAGSGVLIGPRQVLTASHVVAWNTDRPERIEVHRVGATAAAAAWDTAAYAFTKISGDPSYSQLDEDYAVLIMNERLGDRFGWLGTKTYDSGWDGDNVWWTIGYPTDPPRFGSGTQPTCQRDKNLDEDEWDYGSGRAMTTSADAMHGQSGSPMFGFWDDGVYAVAVISAHGAVWASGTENWCSGGSDLDRLVRLARDENP